MTNYKTVSSRHAFLVSFSVRTLHSHHTLWSFTALAPYEIHTYKAVLPDLLISE